MNAEEIKSFIATSIKSAMENYVTREEAYRTNTEVKMLEEKIAALASGAKTVKAKSVNVKAKPDNLPAPSEFVKSSGLGMYLTSTKVGFKVWAKAAVNKDAKYREFILKMIRAGDNTFDTELEKSNDYKSATGDAKDKKLATAIELYIENSKDSAAAKQMMADFFVCKETKEGESAAAAKTEDSTADIDDSSAADDVPAPVVKKPSAKKTKASAGGVKPAASTKNKEAIIEEIDAATLIEEPEVPAAPVTKKVTAKKPGKK